MRSFTCHLMVMVALCVSRSVGAADGVHVYVRHTGNDRAGTAFAYDVRELLRASRGYPLATTEADASLILQLVSLDPSRGVQQLDGLTSAIAITLLVNTSPLQYAGSWIYIVGQSRTQEFAKSIVSSIDGALDAWITEYRTAKEAKDSKELDDGVVSIASQLRDCRTQLAAIRKRP